MLPDLALTDQCNAATLVATRGPGFVLPKTTGFAPLGGAEPTAAELAEIVDTHYESAVSIGGMGERDSRHGNQISKIFLELHLSLTDCVADEFVKNELKSLKLRKLRHVSLRFRRFWMQRSKLSILFCRS